MGEQVFYTPSDLFGKIFRKLLPTKIITEGDKKIDVAQISPLHPLRHRIWHLPWKIILKRKK